jgi:hypothetical protein
LPFIVLAGKSKKNPQHRCYMSCHPSIENFEL